MLCFYSKLCFNTSLAKLSQERDVLPEGHKHKKNSDVTETYFRISIYTYLKDNYISSVTAAYRRTYTKPAAPSRYWIIQNVFYVSVKCITDKHFYVCVYFNEMTKTGTFPGTVLPTLTVEYVALVSRNVKGPILTTYIYLFASFRQHL